VTESERIRASYEQRRANATVDPYDFRRADVFMTIHERQRAIVRAFGRLELPPVADVKLLEVGAGAGGNLLEFLRMGFSPENLVGIELLDERAARARHRLPGSLDLRCEDACQAHVDEESQDIVFQSVVFSSILDRDVQSRLAANMWRWVKPGGFILWYDFVFDNPGNKDVRGVPRRRVTELFPDGRCHCQRVTLAPPIARRVARWHPGLYPLLNIIPMLRTHILCTISKPRARDR